MRTVETFDYEIRKATRLDLDELAELGARFYDESNFLGNLTISRENYKRTIGKYIEGYYSVAGIVAVHDGKIVGYLHIYFQQDFTEERIGEVYQFYVMPEYRGTGVARSLVESANLQYAEWNVARGYVEASPGMDKPEHLKQFENLWGRFGYKKIGIVMSKEFNHGK